MFKIVILFNFIVWFVDQDFLKFYMKFGQKNEKNERGRGGAPSR
jgi:hypothetical protein